MFGKKQILFVGNDLLHHYTYSGHRAYLVDEYFWDQPDFVKKLAQALRKAGGAVTVLSDQTEQQYRKDTVPKVNFFDRSKVIERKLTMSFGQLPFRASLPLNVAANRDADKALPNILFAGLPQTPEMIKLIQAITESEVILGDIGLVPMESVPFINKLVKVLHERTDVIDRPRWTILLTQQKTGGLRQIVLQDGELALTRLTPLFVPNENELGQVRDTIIKEFQATLTYLARFGYVAADGIDVIVVTSEILGEGLQQASLPVTHLYTLTVPEATRLLKGGPKSPADTLYSDSLLAALIVGHKMVLPLNNSAVKPLQQGRRLISGLSALLVLSMLGLCGGAFFYQKNIMHLHEETEVSENDMRQAQVQYNDLAKKLNTLKYQPEMVQAVLNVRDEMVKTNINTEPTIQAIEKLIDKSVYILKSVDIAPAVEINAQTIGGPPPAPPLQTTTTPFPPLVTITLNVDFIARDPKQNAEQTKQLVDKLKTVFTQHQVQTPETVGNTNITETFKGVSSQAAELDLKKPELEKNETSQITITGAAL